MTTLYIDTSRGNEVMIGLEINGKVRKKVLKNVQSQNVLQLIDSVLKENKVKLKDLKAIKVNTGPGSFTGLRVGVSVANALSFALKIPVNNKKVGEQIHPIYGK